MDPVKPPDQVSENKVLQTSTATLAELQYHFEGLRGLFLLALLGLVAGVLAVDVFFLRTWMVSARLQMDNQRIQVSKLKTAFKKDIEPLATNFTSSLQSFAATNQDFQPILDKYRVVLGPYMTAAPAPSLQPAAVPPK